MSDESDEKPVVSATGKKRQPGWENVLPHRIKPGERRNPQGHNGAPWRNMMRRVALEKVVDPIGADPRCTRLTDRHADDDCICKNKKLIPLFKLLVKAQYLQALKKENMQAGQYIIDQMAGRAHQSVQVEQTGNVVGGPLVLMGLPDDGSGDDLDAVGSEEDSEGGEPQADEPPPGPDAEE